MRHNKGIILLCLGGKYVGWAVNFCASLRAFSNSEPIRIVCDSDAMAGLKTYADAVQCELVLIAEQHKMNRSGRFSPGWAKLNVIHYVPKSWQRVLFADIDTICTGSIAQIWAEKGVIRSALTGRYAPDAKRWNCQWMPLDEVRKRYKLRADAPILEVNSSLFLFDYDAGRELYEVARKHYDHNWRKNMWGGTFPDELAINVALNQIGADYADLAYMDFGAEKGRPLLSFYGGMNFQPRRHTDKYDLHAKASFQKIYGKPTPYTFKSMIKSKHVETGRKAQSVTNHEEVIIRNNAEAISPFIPTYQAEPIDASKLLQDTGFGHIPCHTNMGLIRHYGEVIAAYRTEQPPYWKNSRVCITELDAETMQPVREGDMLYLGGQAEDPRLYRRGAGGLAVCYTDGKAVFRADLSKVSGKWEALNRVQLVRGGGLALPDSDGREKNWMPIDGTDIFVCNIGAEGLIVTNGEGSAIRLGDGITWDYGNARGSTPIVPLPDGGYIGLFHSKRENKMFGFSLYYVGAFVLDADLRLVSWSRKPLLAPPFEPKTTPRPNWKICCVFPCGLSIVGSSVIISAGENDFRSVVYRLELSELLKSVN